jgi:hypothetical protein
MTGYELTQKWYEFKFENPSRVRHIHSDMFFYLVYLWNKLGKKKEFGLPTDITMESLGIGSYNTYKAALNDLIEFGAVKLIKDSKNQHHAKIIALSFIDKADNEATDKAGDKPSDNPNEKAVANATDEAIDKASALSKNDKPTIEAPDNASAKPTDSIIKEENYLNKINTTSTTSTTETPKDFFKSENQKNETSPDSGPPPSYNWNNLRDVLLADENWVIWAKMALKMDVAELEDLILEYIVEQHGKGKRLNPDYADLKEHVVNYGRIKIRKEKETQKIQSNGNSTNRSRNFKNDGPTAILNRDDNDY